MVYIVSYDLRNTFLRDVHSFYDELSRTQDNAGRNITWMHYLERTWLISTEETQAELNQRLVNHLQPSDFFLVMRVYPEYSGALPDDAWQWIDQQNQQRRF